MPFKKKVPLKASKPSRHESRRATRVEVQLMMECEDDDLSPAQLQAQVAAQKEHQRANELIKKARAGNTLVPSSQPNTFTVVPPKVISPPPVVRPPAPPVSNILNQQIPIMPQIASQLHLANPVSLLQKQVMQTKPVPSQDLSLVDSITSEPTMPPPRPQQFLNKQQPRKEDTSPDVMIIGETPPRPAQVMANKSVISPQIAGVPPRMTDVILDIFRVKYGTENIETKGETAEDTSPDVMIIGEMPPRPAQVMANKSVISPQIAGVPPRMTEDTSPDVMIIGETPPRPAQVMANKSVISPQIAGVPPRMTDVTPTQVYKFTLSQTTKFFREPNVKVGADDKRNVAKEDTSPDVMIIGETPPRPAQVMANKSVISPQIAGVPPRIPGVTPTQVYKFVNTNANTTPVSTGSHWLIKPLQKVAPQQQKQQQDQRRTPTVIAPPPTILPRSPGSRGQEHRVIQEICMSSSTNKQKQYCPHIPHDHMLNSEARQGGRSIHSIAAGESSNTQYHTWTKAKCIRHYVKQFFQHRKFLEMKYYMDNFFFKRWMTQSINSEFSETRPRERSGGTNVMENKLRKDHDAPFQRKTCNCSLKQAAVTSFLLKNDNELHCDSNITKISAFHAGALNHSTEQSVPAFNCDTNSLIPHPLKHSKLREHNCDCLKNNCGVKDTKCCCKCSYCDYLSEQSRTETDSECVTKTKSSSITSRTSNKHNNCPLLPYSVHSNWIYIQPPAQVLYVYPLYDFKSVNDGEMTPNNSAREAGSAFTRLNRGEFATPSNVHPESSLVGHSGSGVRDSRLFSPYIQSDVRQANYQPASLSGNNMDNAPSMFFSSLSGDLESSEQSRYGISDDSLQLEDQEESVPEYIQAGLGFHSNYDAACDWTFSQDEGQKELEDARKWVEERRQHLPNDSVTPWYTHLSAEDVRYITNLSNDKGWTNVSKALHIPKIQLLNWGREVKKSKTIQPSMHSPAFVNRNTGETDTAYPQIENPVLTLVDDISSESHVKSSQNYRSLLTDYFIQRGRNSPNDQSSFQKNCNTDGRLHPPISVSTDSGQYSYRRQVPSESANRNATENMSEIQKALGESAGIKPTTSMSLNSMIDRLKNSLNSSDDNSALNELMPQSQSIFPQDNENVSKNESDNESTDSNNSSDDPHALVIDTSFESPNVSSSNKDKEKRTSLENVDNLQNDTNNSNWVTDERNSSKTHDSRQHFIDNTKETSDSVKEAGDSSSSGIESGNHLKTNVLKTVDTIMDHCYLGSESQVTDTRANTKEKDFESDSARESGKQKLVEDWTHGKINPQVQWCMLNGKRVKVIDSLPGDKKHLLDVIDVTKRSDIFSTSKDPEDKLRTHVKTFSGEIKPAKIVKQPKPIANVTGARRFVSLNNIADRMSSSNSTKSSTTGRNTVSETLQTDEVPIDEALDREYNELDDNGRKIIKDLAVWASLSGVQRRKVRIADSVKEAVVGESYIIGQQATSDKYGMHTSTVAKWRHDCMEKQLGKADRISLIRPRKKQNVPPKTIEKLKKVKFSDDLKIKIAHLSEAHGSAYISRQYNIGVQTIRKWMEVYKGQKLKSYELADEDFKQLIANDEFKKKLMIKRTEQKLESLLQSQPIQTSTKEASTRDNELLHVQIENVNEDATDSTANNEKVSAEVNIGTFVSPTKSNHSDSFEEVCSWQVGTEKTGNTAPRTGTETNPDTARRTDTETNPDHNDNRSELRDTFTDKETIGSEINHPNLRHALQDKSSSKVVHTPSGLTSDISVVSAYYGVAGNSDNSTLGLNTTGKDGTVKSLLSRRLQHQIQQEQDKSFVTVASSVAKNLSNNFDSAVSKTQAGQPQNMMPKHMPMASSIITLSSSSSRTSLATSSNSGKTATVTTFSSNRQNFPLPELQRPLVKTSVSQNTSTSETFTLTKLDKDRTDTRNTPDQIVLTSGTRIVKVIVPNSTKQVIVSPGSTNSVIHDVFKVYTPSSGPGTTGSSNSSNSIIGDVLKLSTSSSGPGKTNVVYVSKPKPASSESPLISVGLEFKKADSENNSTASVGRPVRVKPKVPDVEPCVNQEEVTREQGEIRDRLLNQDTPKVSVPEVRYLGPPDELINSVSEQPSNKASKDDASNKEAKKGEDDTSKEETKKKKDEKFASVVSSRDIQNVKDLKDAYLRLKKWGDTEKHITRRRWKCRTPAKDEHKKSSEGDSKDSSPETTQPKDSSQKLQSGRISDLINNITDRLNTTDPINQQHTSDEENQPESLAKDTPADKHGGRISDLISNVTNRLNTTDLINPPQTLAEESPADKDSGKLSDLINNITNRLNADQINQSQTSAKEKTLETLTKDSPADKQSGRISDLINNVTNRLKTTDPIAPPQTSSKESPAESDTDDESSSLASDISSEDSTESGDSSDESTASATDIHADESSDNSQDISEKLKSLLNADIFANIGEEENQEHANTDDSEDIMNILGIPKSENIPKAKAGKENTSFHDKKILDQKAGVNEKRKLYSLRLKIKLGKLASIKGVSNVSRQYSIHPKTLSTWKNLYKDEKVQNIELSASELKELEKINEAAKISPIKTNSGKYDIYIDNPEMDTDCIEMDDYNPGSVNSADSVMKPGTDKAPWKSVSDKLNSLKNMDTNITGESFSQEEKGNDSRVAIASKKLVQDTLNFKTSKTYVPNIFRRANNPNKPAKSSANHTHSTKDGVPFYFALDEKVSGEEKKNLRQKVVNPSNQLNRGIFLESSSPPESKSHDGNVQRSSSGAFVQSDVTSGSTSVQPGVFYSSHDKNDETSGSSQSHPSQEKERDQYEASLFEQTKNLIKDLNSKVGPSATGGSRARKNSSNSGKGTTSVQQIPRNISVSELKSRFIKKGHTVEGITIEHDSDSSTSSDMPGGRTSTSPKSVHVTVKRSLSADSKRASKDSGSRVSKEATSHVSKEPTKQASKDPAKQTVKEPVRRSLSLEQKGDETFDRIEKVGSFLWKWKIVREARNAGFESTASAHEINMTEIMKWHDDFVKETELKTKLAAAQHALLYGLSDAVSVFKVTREYITGLFKGEKVDNPVQELPQSTDNIRMEESIPVEEPVATNKEARRNLQFETVERNGVRIRRPKFQSTSTAQPTSLTENLRKTQKTRMGPNSITYSSPRNEPVASTDQEGEGFNEDAYLADTRADLGTMPRIVKHPNQGVEIASTWKQIQSVIKPQKSNERKFTQEFKNRIIKECEERGQKVVAREHRLPYNEVSRWRLEAKKLSMSKSKQTSLHKEKSQQSQPISSQDNTKQPVKVPKSSSLTGKDNLNEPERGDSQKESVSNTNQEKKDIPGKEKESLKIRIKLNKNPEVLSEKTTEKPVSERDTLSSEKNDHSHSHEDTSDGELRLQVVDYCVQFGVLKTQKKFGLIRQSIVDLMSEYDDYCKTSFNYRTRSADIRNMKTRLVSRDKTSVEETMSQSTPVIVHNLKDYIVTQDYKDSVAEYAREHGITAATRKFKRKTSTVKSWMGHYAQRLRKQKKAEEMLKQARAEVMAEIEKREKEKKLAEAETEKTATETRVSQTKETCKSLEPTSPVWDQDFVIKSTSGKSPLKMTLSPRRKSPIITSPGENDRELESDEEGDITEEYEEVTNVDDIGDDSVNKDNIEQAAPGQDKSNATNSRSEDKPNSTAKHTPIPTDPTIQICENVVKEMQKVIDDSVNAELLISPTEVPNILEMSELFKDGESDVENNTIQNNKPGKVDSQISSNVSHINRIDESTVSQKEREDDKNMSSSSVICLSDTEENNEFDSTLIEEDEDEVGNVIEDAEKTEESSPDKASKSKDHVKDASSTSDETKNVERQKDDTKVSDHETTIKKPGKIVTEPIVEKEKIPYEETLMYKLFTTDVEDFFTTKQASRPVQRVRNSADFEIIKNIEETCLFGSSRHQKQDMAEGKDDSIDTVPELEEVNEEGRDLERNDSVLSKSKSSKDKKVSEVNQKDSSQLEEGQEQMDTNVSKIDESKTIEVYDESQKSSAEISQAQVTGQEKSNKESVATEKVETKVKEAVVMLEKTENVESEFKQQKTEDGMKDSVNEVEPEKVENRAIVENVIGKLSDNVDSKTEGVCEESSEKSAEKERSLFDFFTMPKTEKDNSMKEREQSTNEAAKSNIETACVDENKEKKKDSKDKVVKEPNENSPDVAPPKFNIFGNLMKSFKLPSSVLLNKNKEDSKSNSSKDDPKPPQTKHLDEVKSEDIKPNTEIKEQTENLDDPAEDKNKDRGERNLFDFMFPAPKTEIKSEYTEMKSNNQQVEKPTVTLKPNVENEKKDAIKPIFKFNKLPVNFGSIAKLGMAKFKGSDDAKTKLQTSSEEKTRLEVSSNTEGCHDLTQQENKDDSCGITSQRTAEQKTVTLDTKIHVAGKDVIVDIAQNETTTENKNVTKPGIVMETFEELRKRLAKERAISKVEKEKKAETVNEKVLESETVDEKDREAEKPVEEIDFDTYKEFPAQKITLIIDIAKKHGIDFASSSFGLPIPVIVNWIIEKDRKHRKTASGVTLENKLLIGIDMMKGTEEDYDDIAAKYKVNKTDMIIWQKELMWLLERQDIKILLNKWQTVESMKSLENPTRKSRNSVSEKSMESEIILSEKAIERTEKVDSSDTLKKNKTDDSVMFMENKSDEVDGGKIDEKNLENCQHNEEKLTQENVTESQEKERNEESVDKSDNDCVEIVELTDDSQSQNLTTTEDNTDEYKVPDVLEFTQHLNPRDYNIEQKAMIVLLIEKFGIKEVHNKIGVNKGTLWTWKNQNRGISKLIQEHRSGFREKKVVSSTETSPVGSSKQLSETGAQSTETGASSIKSVSGPKLYKSHPDIRRVEEESITAYHKGYRLISPSKIPPILENARLIPTKDFTFDQRVAIVKLVDLYGVRTVHKQFRIPQGSIWNWQHAKNITKTLRKEETDLDHSDAKRNLQFDNEPQSIDIVQDRAMVTCETINHLNFNSNQKSDIVCLIDHFGLQYVCDKFPQIPRGTLWNWSHNKNIRTLVERKTAVIHQFVKKDDKDIDTRAKNKTRESIEKDLDAPRKDKTDLSKEKVLDAPTKNKTEQSNEKDSNAPIKNKTDQSKEYHSDKDVKSIKSPKQLSVDRDSEGSSKFKSPMSEEIDKAALTQVWVSACQQDGGVKRKAETSGRKTWNSGGDGGIKKQCVRPDGNTEWLSYGVGLDGVCSEKDFLKSIGQSSVVGSASVRSKEQLGSRTRTSSMSSFSSIISEETNEYEEMLSDDEVNTSSNYSKKSGEGSIVKKTVDSAECTEQEERGEAITELNWSFLTDLPVELDKEIDTEKMFDVLQIEEGSHNRIMVSYKIVDEEESPVPKKKARKEGLGEIDTAGHWVPLDEYYYGSMEGDANYTEEKGEFRFKCWYCSKMLYNNVRAMQHIQGHIDSSKQQNIDLSDLTQCKHCYKQFDTPFEMQTHLEKVHLSNKVLMCRICEKDFNNTKDLILHMRSSHLPCEMPYACQLCGFRSSMYSDVVDHFKKKHDSSNSMLCLYCLRVFNIKFVSQGWGQTQTYYGHLLKHQAKTSMKKCNICRLMFFNPIDVKNHRKTCHVSNKFGHKTLSKGKQSSGDQLMVNVNEKGGGKKDANLKSLNAPSVSKMQDFRGIMLPKQTNTLTCYECKMKMSTTDHYKKYVTCSMCRFATSCSVAYANHMMGFHSGQLSILNLNIPRERPMKQVMYCVCGFKTKYGTKMANHLAFCPKHYCTVKKPSVPQVTAEKQADGNEGGIFGALGLVQKKPISTVAWTTQKSESKPEKATENKTSDVKSKQSVEKDKDKTVETKPAAATSEPVDDEVQILDDVKADEKEIIDLNDSNDDIQDKTGAEKDKNSEGKGKTDEEKDKTGEGKDKIGENAIDDAAVSKDDDLKTGKKEEIKTDGKDDNGSNVPDNGTIPIDQDLEKEKNEETAIEGIEESGAVPMDVDLEGDKTEDIADTKEESVDDTEKVESEEKESIKEMDDITPSGANDTKKPELLASSSEKKKPDESEPKNDNENQAEDDDQNEDENELKNDENQLKDDDENEPENDKNEDDNENEPNEEEGKEIEGDEKLKSDDETAEDEESQQTEEKSADKVNTEIELKDTEEDELTEEVEEKELKNVDENEHDDEKNEDNDITDESADVDKDLESKESTESNDAEPKVSPTNDQTATQKDEEEEEKVQQIDEKGDNNQMETDDDKTADKADNKMEEVDISHSTETEQQPDQSAQQHSQEERSHDRDRSHDHERSHESQRSYDSERSGDRDRSYNRDRSHDRERSHDQQRQQGSHRSDDYHGNRSSYDRNRDRDRSYDRDYNRGDNRHDNRSYDNRHGYDNRSDGNRSSYDRNRDRDRSYDRDYNRGDNRHDNRGYDNRHGYDNRGGYNQGHRGQGHRDRGNYGGHHHGNRGGGGYNQDRNYNRNYGNRGGYRGGYRGSYY